MRGRGCISQRGLRLMNSMRTPLIKQALWLLLASALSFASGWCARAQNTASNQAVSSGAVGFFFTNSTATVYDLTGSYQFEQQAAARGSTPLDLSLGFSVQQDAAGRL